jgi:hypothetical protein
LAEHQREQLDPDVAAVWVGNGKHAIATDHELMLRTRIWTCETRRRRTAMSCRRLTGPQAGISSPV